MFRRRIGTGRIEHVRQIGTETATWQKPEADCGSGVAEVVVASYWTSVTDHEHGVVDKAQRRGTVFRSARTGVEADADLHASETLAQYLLLGPMTKARCVTNALSPLAA